MSESCHSSTGWQVLGIRTIQTAGSGGSPGNCPPAKSFIRSPGSILRLEDANLRITATFFSDPTLSEEDALGRIADSYGKASGQVIRFWRKTSEAMELFPWEASWFIREIGRCDPAHALSAAFLRGQQAHTPSWQSTRRAIFMKTDNSQPDPWMLEDVQLRCDLAAARMTEAIDIGNALAEKLKGSLARCMEAQIIELASWRKRALSYVYHIRETNLTRHLRREIDEARPVPQNVVKELRDLLAADIDNGAENLQSALESLDSNPRQFAQRYFVEVKNDGHSKGVFSITSR